MQRNKLNETISVGDTQTGTIILNKYALNGFLISGSVITGSQVSFLVSTDGTNFYPLYNSSGTEITIPVTSSGRGYSLDYTVFKPFNFVKLRLGYSGSSVAQKTYELGIDFLLTSLD
jgi:hypothetical protein